MEYTEEIMKKSLKRCIEGDRLKSYLLGTGIYFIKEDPRFEDSPHAYYTAMKVYNDMNKTNPELKLDERFLNELNQILDGEDAGFRTYEVFKCLKAQRDLENRKKESFKMDKEKLNAIIAKIRGIAEENKALLTRYSYKEGERYQGRMYEFLTSGLRTLEDPSDPDLPDL